MVWAYHSPGHPIPTWADCFSARQEESGEQWSHQVGLISWVSSTRLVFIPSTLCHQAGQPFLLAVVNLVTNTSLSLQERDEFLSQHFYTDCLNQTLPGRKMNRQSKEINNTLNLEIEIKVEAAEKKSNAEMNRTDVIQFTEFTRSDELTSPKGWSQTTQNLLISGVKSSEEPSNINNSVAVPTTTDPVELSNSDRIDFDVEHLELEISAVEVELDDNTEVVETEDDNSEIVNTEDDNITEDTDISDTSIASVATINDGNRSITEKVSDKTDVTDVNVVTEVPSNGSSSNDDENDKNKDPSLKSGDPSSRARISLVQLLFMAFCLFLLGLFASKLIRPDIFCI